MPRDLVLSRRDVLSRNLWKLRGTSPACEPFINSLLSFSLSLGCIILHEMFVEIQIARLLLANAARNEVICALSAEVERGKY